MIQVPSPGSGGGGGGGGGGGPGGGGGGTSPRGNNKYDRLRRKSLAFLASLFRLRRRNNCLIAGMRIAEETKTMQRSPRLDNPALATGSLVGGCRPRSAASQHQPPQQQHHHQHHHHHQQQQQHQESEEMEGPNGVSRIPSTLSVAAVDVVLACRQAASPSHSILTLTPGRTRNIDQDMEALRLSRQDNPFLQVLASKESLIEPVEESESDDAILMSQEFGDTDPLTLAQVHEHLVRSPPPASWSRTPMFHFPHQQQQDNPGSRSEPTQQQHRAAATSPKSMLHRDDQPKSEGSMEIRDRHSHTFSLLNPTPIRSLSEVRRLHRSAEDSVQLMSSES